MTCTPQPTPEWLLGALLREVERELPRLRPVEQWTFHAARRSPALADVIRQNRGVACALDAAGVVLLAGLLRFLVEQLADRGSPGLHGGAFFWQEAARLSDDPHEQQSLASARLPLIAGAVRADLVDRLSAAALAVPHAATVAVLAVRGGDESELAGAMFDVLSAATPPVPTSEQAEGFVIDLTDDGQGIEMNGESLAYCNGANEPRLRVRGGRGTSKEARLVLFGVTADESHLGDDDDPAPTEVRSRVRTMLERASGRVVSLEGSRRTGRDRWRVTGAALGPRLAALSARNVAGTSAR